MASRRFAIGCLVALSIVSAPLVAAEEGDKIVRFGVVYSSPTDDLAVAGTTTEADDALGLQAAFEFMVTDKIGVVPALQSVSYDVEAESGALEVDLGEIDVFQVTAAVNFHVGSWEKVDVFVGPLVGYAFLSSLQDGELGDFGTDDEFVYGFTAGVDVPFGNGGWAFNGGLDYLLSEIALEGATEEIGVDPFQLKVGVAYSF